MNASALSWVNMHKATHPDREWAASPVPVGYTEMFQRWELFHTLRALTALAAFVLFVTVAIVARPSTR
ncbi:MULTISPECIES: hypothetical protein [Streptosporangium]|uniref:Uncharacterized protein n=1 Tax=Streptosporangium brasiliense TaxID=47480 RepID=A0ABT9RKQ1_9ACTN|nr:hypothetical protein [Streptosporangium brasiliense]MDP9869883.1 hypothetical protein [Streptosporangium brasiliense]